MIALLLFCVWLNLPPVHTSHSQPKCSCSLKNIANSLSPPHLLKPPRFFCISSTAKSFKIQFNSKWEKKTDSKRNDLMPKSEKLESSLKEPHGFNAVLLVIFLLLWREGFLRLGQQSFRENKELFFNGFTVTSMQSQITEKTKTQAGKRLLGMYAVVVDVVVVVSMKIYHLLHTYAVQLF